MTHAHRTIFRDVGLRLAGLLSLLVAYLAFGRLGESYGASPHAAAAIDFGCAALGFLSASGGAGLSLWGNAMFDRVTVSQRWVSDRTLGPHQRPASRAPDDTLDRPIAPS